MSSSTTGTCAPEIVHLQPMNREKGDPLQDDGKLLWEPKPTLRKSQSNQAFELRWGSNRRKTGRSKASLQITVPDHKKSLSMLTTGPILIDKSILYTYTSSSSGGSWTPHSFGSVGDRISTETPGKAKSLPFPQTSIEPAHFDKKMAECQSPLKDLVNTSMPDQELYKLLAVGRLASASAPAERKQKRWATEAVMYFRSQVGKIRHHQLSDPAGRPPETGNQTTPSGNTNASAMQHLHIKRIQKACGKSLVKSCASLENSLSTHMANRSNMLTVRSSKVSSSPMLRNGSHISIP